MEVTNIETRCDKCDGGNSQGHFNGTAHEAAVWAGWIVKDGKDVCPDCQEGEYV